MLTAELKAKWLAALRSGKYSQGVYLLHDQDGGYCPLGVLMDVSGLGEWETSWSRSYSYRIPGSPYRLTNRIPCELVSHSRQLRIAHMNDLGRVSFADIADWIEENVPVCE